jgi:hypothetical protein
VSNYPYLSAERVLRSRLRRRQIEAQQRAEAEMAVRRRSGRTSKARKTTSTTTPEEG